MIDDLLHSKNLVFRVDVKGRNSPIYQKFISYLLIRTRTLLYSVYYLFFLYQSPFSCLGTVFDVVLPKADKVYSINPTFNVFSVAKFNVHHKECVTCFSKPGELETWVTIFENFNM